MRLEDILEAVLRIRDYTRGTTFEEFCGDKRTVDAVVRNLEVIGEAARNIDLDIRARHPEIPWKRMLAMRNILAHEYFAVDLGILWQTANANLPPLVPALRGILDAEGAND